MSYSANGTTNSNELDLPVSKTAVQKVDVLVDLAFCVLAIIGYRLSGLLVVWGADLLDVRHDVRSIEKKYEKVVEEKEKKIFKAGVAPEDIQTGSTTLE